MPERYEEIALFEIVPSPYNPRRTFDPTALEELAQTIREHGVLEPAVVRPNPKGEGYELVMGERRFRASAIAEKITLPCIVRDYSDAQVLEVIVIENNQRADVNAVEESIGFARILELESYKSMGRNAAVKELARKLGRSESYVWQRLKLGDLSDEAKDELLAGAITPGHAILLARHSHEVQAQLLTDLLWETAWNSETQGYDRKGRRETGVRYSVRELMPLAARKAGIAMAMAPFDLAAPFEGVGRGHSCDVCPARTINDPARGEDAADACRDGECFKAKCAAHVALRIEELSAQYPKLIRISGQWQTDLPGVENSTSYDRVDERAPKARPSIVVETRETHRLGELVWTTKSVRGSGQTREEIEAKKREDEEKERKVKCERGYRLGVLRAVAEAVPDPVDGTLVRLAARERRSRIYNDAEARLAMAAAGLDKSIKRDAKARDFDALTPLQAARYFVSLLACEELVVETYTLSRVPTRIFDLATLYGVDAQAIHNEAYGQGKLFPAEPKAEAYVPPPLVPGQSLIEYIDEAEEGTKEENRNVLDWAKSLALTEEIGARIGLAVDTYFALFDALVDSTAGTSDFDRMVAEKNRTATLLVSDRRFFMDAEGKIFPGLVPA